MNNYLMNIDFVLIDILKYLDVHDLAKIMCTSKTFYKTINEYNSKLFEHFELRYSSEFEEMNFKWFLKIIENNEIKSLNLILCECLPLARLILSKVSSEQLHTLSIPLTLLESKTDLKRFNKMRNLSIKNVYFNEGGMEQNIFLISNLIPQTQITKLKLNNIKFISAEFLNYLQCQLTYLDLRECMEFKIEDFELYLLHNSSRLKVLKLDGENSNMNQLINILPSMDALNELTISYCENLKDNFLYMIKAISSRFTKLVLRKMRSITTECFENFFEEAELDNIEKLDFYDASHLGSMAVGKISRCHKLKYLDISWSELVKNESVCKILTQCPSLQKVYFQGCKLLDDTLFDSFLNKDNLGYKNLIYMDLTKCDLIPDNVIKSVLDKYPWITIINYYGRDLKNNDFYIHFNDIIFPKKVENFIFFSKIKFLIFNE